ncbi:MAG: tape measure protein [Pseudomonadota bacterium]
MPTPNEVELLIKARNEAGKTLDRLAKELDDLVDSQKALADSTQLAQKSQKELVDQARQLLAVTDALNKTTGRIDGYKKQQAALADLNVQLEKQKQALASARVEFEKLQKPTKAQEKSLRDLGKAVASTERDITRGVERIGKLGAELAELGVSTDDIAGSERRLAEQQNRVTAALDTTSKAVDRLTGAQTELATAEKRRQQQATDTANEVKRRVAEEEAAMKRRLEAQRRYNDLARVSLPGGQAGRDRLGDAVDTLGAELERQEKIEASLRQQQAAESELAKRSAEQEASLRRQEAAQKRINTLLNVRDADPDRARGREADVRAALAEDAARREVRAQELRVAAAQRVLDVNRRADAVEARLRQRQQETVGVTGRLADALRRLAGVQERGAALTERQATAQARGTSQAGQTASAIDRVTAAQNRQNKALQNGFELQRTALSLYQRIRGQLLSVAGAYVGLFGAINLVQKSIDDVNTKAAVQNRLLVVTGNDAAAAAKEYEYLRKESERLGTNFVSLANGYSKFAIAAKGANLGAEETRFIFESFAETSKVFRLSTDETAGVFRALEQILSKAKIQAEELRGQLGDRLSGAFNVLAKAIGKTPAELDKLLESGKVSSDFLLLFAREYKNIVAEQLPAATKTLDANIQRLGNGLFDLRVAFLEGPFREELEKLIARFTAFVRSEDGAEFARGLSTAFATAGKVILFLAENIKLIGITIGIVFGAKTLVAIAQFGGVLVTAAKGAAALSAALGLGGLLGAARAAALGLGALISGPIGILVGLAATGIVIALKFKVDDAKALGKGVDEAVKAANKASVDVLSAKTQAELRPLLDDAKTQVGAIDKALADAKRALTREQASFFGGRQAEFTNPETIRKKEEASFGVTRKRIADLEARREALVASIAGAERKMAQLPEIAAEGIDKAIAGNDALTNGLQAQFDALEKAAKALTIPDKDADKAAKKAETAAKRLAALQLRLKEQFNEQAAAIGQDLAEAEAKSFERATALIDAQSDEKIRELRRLRDEMVNARLPEFTSQIDALIGKVNEARDRAKETARDEFAAKDFAAAESTVNKLMTQRADIISSENALREAGLRTSREAADNIAEQVSRLDPIIEQALNKALDLAYALGGPEGEAAVQRIQAMKTEMELLAVALTQAEQQAVQLIAGNLTNAFEATAQSVGDLIRGVQSFGDFFKSLGQITRQFFSQLLIDIGLAIARQVILNALLNAAKGGGAGGTIIGAIAGLLHDGGPATGGKSRIVDPRIFNNAVRYHSGGVVGLKPDEIPAVLQKGEYVMSKGDARNPLNGGGGSRAQDIQVLNTIDTESIYQSAATSQTFRKTILNIVRAERGSFKQALA